MITAGNKTFESPEKMVDFLTDLCKVFKGYKKSEFEYWLNKKLVSSNRIFGIPGGDEIYCQEEKEKNAVMHYIAFVYYSKYYVKA